MDAFERHKSSSSGASRSFLSRTLTRRDGNAEATPDVKGPLGLNTLYIPTGTTIADLVFVHGLGGGSRSTWTKDGEPSLYWPKEWLPDDPGFQDVRIHSFGYNSNWEKESSLNVHDFSKSLLSAIHDCPTIPRTADTPLILVGHSMGGLVIKRAYILAQQKGEFMTTARRIQAIFFLATPHRGADLAHLLSKILNITPGQRPFVTDLHRNSLATQSINDEFPHYSQNLQLFSFYETLPTSYGVGKSLVVDKDLATLNYANERTAYLEANHRNVCKYADQTDTNYKTVRNALASTMDSFRTRSTVSKRELDRDQRRRLDTHLRITDAPEDDFMDIDSLRMRGSCEWLLQRGSFLDWRDSANTQLYWISAKPATGKTIASGRVVSHLRDLNRDCAFYFFKHGDKSKSTIQSFLLSIAWQMASTHTEVFHVVLEVCEKNESLSQADYRTIWRKLFLEGLLKVALVRPQYWIIDGLDECRNNSDMVPLLLKATESCAVRILLTSRDPFESHRQTGHPRARVLGETISTKETKSDIALYLEANMSHLPSVDQEDRQVMFTKILEKSAGCFLWVKLILQELGRVHTSAEIRQVLEDVPSDMNEVYSRILNSMSAAPYGKVLAKAILTWAACAARPLTTEELFHALQIDIRDSIDSVERSIASSCGQLVYVDSHSRVQLIHQTARDYLLQGDIHPEFRVEKRVGHKRLALTCLQYLNGSEMRGPRHRKLSFTSLVKERSPLVAYASIFLFDHIIHVDATDEEVLSALAKFMGSSNVLSWIEYIARFSDLTRLIQAGKVLRSFLHKRTKKLSPLGKDFALLDSWATDLLRLVTKFGKDLLGSPSSIFNLIPPFCPQESAPRKNFAASPRSIAVLGLSATEWDDCASTIFEPNEQFHALACSERHFAIGTFGRNIVLYNAETCQEIQRFHHCEPVRLLHFGKTEKILAAAGVKSIRIWDLTTKKQIWDFKTPQLCMSLATTEGDELLLGALKSNNLLVWDLKLGALRDCANWTDDLEGQRAHTFRRPIAAAFGMDSNLLAVVYRGQDILLWDLERDALYDTYNKMAGASPMLGRQPADAGAIALTFNRAPGANLLAAAYSDGDLVLFDTSDGYVKAIITANAQTLACSPDGRTLAGGDGSGKLQIFDFETLKLLYCIHSTEHGIKEIQFSGDNLQILDIRGSHCRIWDPVVLVRQDAEDESSDVVSLSTAPQEVHIDAVEDTPVITALTCQVAGEMFFSGKEDGSVHMYEAKSGKHMQNLLNHAKGVSITALSLDEESNALCTTDSSSRVMVHRLVRQPRCWNVNEAIFDHRVGVSVNQVLSNKGCTRLLVSSTSSDTLWSISANTSEMIGTVQKEDRGACRWSTHPLREDQLLLIAGNVAHLYDWLTLSRLTNPEGILLQGSILPELMVQSVSPCFGGSIIATAFKESIGARAKSKLMLWNSSDFNLQATSAVPVPKYHYLSDQVQVLIGSEGQKLVFLHGSGWVCSVDTQATGMEHFIRHFFFPADWLSTDSPLLIKITRRSDIIFVKRDEIAVIKRGLETSERGSDGDIGKSSSLTDVRRPLLQVPAEPH
ncbi:MAG: hypothetical protein LQ346_001104 [Caloplaca aetnensis]|nr:MAG: hypothetical protein LQ346_001104 [Caloplaca aetnensis]